MAPETPEISPEEEKPKIAPRPDASPEQKFAQSKPGSPVIPVEVWKKMTEEEKEKVGQDAWREQA